MKIEWHPVHDEVMCFITIGKNELQITKEQNKIFFDLCRGNYTIDGMDIHDLNDIQTFAQNNTEYSFLVENIDLLTQCTEKTMVQNLGI